MNISETLTLHKEDGPNNHRVVDLRQVSDRSNRLSLAMEEISRTPCPRLVLADVDGPLVLATKYGWPGKTFPQESADFIKKVISMEDTRLVIVTSRPNDNLFRGKAIRSQLKEQGINAEQIMSPGSGIVFPVFKLYVAFTDPNRRLNLEDARSFVFLGDGLLDRVLCNRIVERRPKGSTNTFVRFPQAFPFPF